MTTALPIFIEVYILYQNNICHPIKTHLLKNDVEKIFPKTPQHQHNGMQKIVTLMYMTKKKGNKKRNTVVLECGRPPT